MEKCATGVCVPVGSILENKPLLIGIAVLAVALIVGGYFWWRSRSSGSTASAQEPQVEEFVGRQGATRAEFEEDAAAAAQQQGGGEAPEEHSHEE